MNEIFVYLRSAVKGFAEFVAIYKMFPLVLGVLLYGILRTGRQQNAKESYFLKYASLAAFLLLFPFTAVFFLVCQTRFYEYGWVWSVVPMTVVLAWGIVTVLDAEVPLPGNKTGKTCLYRAAGVSVAIAVLWICGNQAQVKQAAPEEQRQQEIAESMLRYIKEEERAGDCEVWGPRNMMQYLRRSNGDITLYYGKDMWDAKSGAYDYEAYTPEETAAYNWMELLTSEQNLYLIEIDQAPAEVQEALAEEQYLKAAVADGVNILLLPTQINTWMERKIQNAAEKNGFTVSAVEVSDYTMWMLTGQEEGDVK